MAPPVPLPFFCDLCRKGYARISELEVHETSYDHHHRKRAADLRMANRDNSKRERTSQAPLGSLGGDDGRGKQKKTKRGHKTAFGEASKSSTEIKRLESERTAAISNLYGESSTPSSKDSKSPVVTTAAVKPVSRSAAPNDTRLANKEYASTTMRSQPPPQPRPIRPSAKQHLPSYDDNHLQDDQSLRRTFHNDSYDHRPYDNRSYGNRAYDHRLHDNGSYDNRPHHHQSHNPQSYMNYSQTYDTSDSRLAIVQQPQMEDDNQRAILKGRRPSELRMQQYQDWQFRDGDGGGGGGGLEHSHRTAMLDYELDNLAPGFSHRN